MSARDSSIDPRAGGILLLWVLAVGAAAAGYIIREGVPFRQMAVGLVAFVLLLIPYLGFGQAGFAAACRRFASRGAGAVIALAVLAAAPAAAAVAIGRGSAGLTPAAGVVLYAVAPSLIFALAQRAGQAPNLLDALAVMAAWLPLELGAFSGLWRTPGADPSYVIGKTLGLSVLLIGVVAVRPIEGIGYRWRIRLEDLGVAAVATIAFLILAVPAGLLSGFVVLDPRPASAIGIFDRFLAIGLLVALPEEILFRGVIFNLLQKAMVGRHGPAPALLLSALVFGLSHLNNAPLMDWRYVALATYAGVCYGWCYLRTGNLISGILAHTMVDLAHRLVLVTPAASA